MFKKNNEFKTYTFRVYYNIIPRISLIRSYLDTLFWDFIIIS